MVSFDALWNNSLDICVSQDEVFLIQRGQIAAIKYTPLDQIVSDQESA